ncbi:alcohol dehydrogenase catalytic domain-containing protein [Piscinibacter sp.]|jgi:propanol-preferring alcohol dehydrogenase|uniref:alcohol dehydrogenase catalytic domain-containing protein n=1 Tax=Piscinibacter sp. TaxID=1903157 RepID=UPI002F428460
MKAAILPDFGQPLALEDVPRPVPETDEVLIEVEVCGVCHSDLHIAHGDLPGFRAATKPRLILGHEVVGRVVEKGAAVVDLAIGDRVGVAWLHWACGECEPCREGLENLCRRGVVTGMMVDGGYAEFMRAKASHTLRVPDGLAPEQAAPLFCAGVTVYRALKNAQVRAGQRVAVFGIGGLGHLAVQVARAFGAEVIALDVAESKLALARELGAAATFNVTDPDVLKAVRKLGAVHVAVVTSAAKAAYDLAFKCLRPGGTLAVVGLPAEPLQFAALGIVSNEARIVGAAVGTREDLRAVLALAAAGQLQCRVETQPLAQVNEALDRMQRGDIQGRIVLRCC